MCSVRTSPNYNNANWDHNTNVSVAHHSLKIAKLRLCCIFKWIATHEIHQSKLRYLSDDLPKSTNRVRLISKKRYQITLAVLWYRYSIQHKKFKENCFSHSVHKMMQNCPSFSHDRQGCHEEASLITRCNHVNILNSLMYLHLGVS